MYDTYLGMYIKQDNYFFVYLGVFSILKIVYCITFSKLTIIHKIAITIFFSHSLLLLWSV